LNDLLRTHFKLPALSLCNLTVSTAMSSISPNILKLEQAQRLRENDLHLHA
jgi:hypothetical protein